MDKLEKYLDRQMSICNILNKHQKVAIGRKEFGI